MYADPKHARTIRGPAILALVGLVLGSCGGGDGASEETGDERASDGRLAGWNVLLVTIDTLRHDRVGYAGHAAAETPTLDGLAASGVAFEDAYSAAPVTLPSHATILTGLYPPAHGALDNGFYSLPEGVPTLATELKAAGYDTGAVMGAYVLHGQYGLDAGFDEYDDRFRQPRTESAEARGRTADLVTEKALAWVAGRTGDAPFLLWTHYYDPHWPYSPPEGYERFADPYDGEIAFTDDSLGALLEGLRARDDLARTLVVVVSDHGEAFGDGGETTHGLLLRPSTLRVPLLMSAPGALPEDRRVAGTVSSADIAPTVLDLLGLPLPGQLDGVSLVDAIESGAARERAAYAETRLPLDMYGWSMLAGVATDGWAWVRGPLPELYDLSSDPTHAHNLHPAHEDVARELDGRVQAVLAAARAVEAREELSAADVDALGDLGYAFGSTAAEATGKDPKEMLPIWNEVNELRELMFQKRYGKVLRGLEKVLEQDPGNHEARLLQGQTLVMVGQVQQGLAVFRALFEAGAMPSRSGMIFAKTLVQAGKPDEAEELLRSFVEDEPDFAEHHYNLGVLLSQVGRLDDAITAYREAYRLNPEAVHVLANLAETLARRGASADADEAIALAASAAELSEDDRARLVLIYVCLAFDRRERAEEEARTLRAKEHLIGVTREEIGGLMRQFRR